MSDGTAILFDLDGTLADTRPDLVAALNAALLPEGFNPVGIEEIGHAAGHGSLAMIDLACKMQGRDFSDSERMATQKRFLDHYEANIAVSTTLFPGGPEAIEAIRLRGMTSAVCTNKPEYLARRLLQELGFSDTFAAIAGGDTFQYRKPDGRHISSTIELAGAKRGVMIGDTVTDLDAARAANVPVLLVDFGYSEVPVAGLLPDAVISHFDELMDQIDRLTS